MNRTALLTTLLIAAMAVDLAIPASEEDPSVVTAASTPRPGGVADSLRSPRPGGVADHPRSPRPGGVADHPRSPRPGGVADHPRATPRPGGVAEGPRSTREEEPQRGARSEGANDALSTGCSSPSTRCFDEEGSLQQTGPLAEEGAGSEAPSSSHDEGAAQDEALGARKTLERPYQGRIRTDAQKGERKREKFRVKTPRPKLERGPRSRLETRREGTPPRRALGFAAQLDPVGR